MSETPINQTQFVAEAEVPEVPKPPELKSENTDKSTKKPISLPIFLVVITLILSVIGGGLYWTQQRGEHITVTPVPQASTAPIEASKIRADIQPYFDQINALNPETDDHPFPPVDFTVRMKDPNSTQ
jgi:hypothetical protein